MLGSGSRIPHLEIQGRWFPSKSCDWDKISFLERLPHAARDCISADVRGDMEFPRLAVGFAEVAE